MRWPDHEQRRVDTIAQSLPNLAWTLPAYRNRATCSLSCSGADGTALSIFSMGRNGEDDTNSMRFAATTESAARLCRPSIYNCRIRKDLDICWGAEDANSWGNENQR